jgi:carbon storage regulator CsrA
MLVLSRKSQEVVVVGAAGGGAPLLTVTVLEIGNGKVRLGFTAETTLAIHRWEVWQRMHAMDAPSSPAGEPEAPVA